MKKNVDLLFGHPKGLFVLFSTELWERFSYYAMRAILVLYLTDVVQDYGGGLGWSAVDALYLYGNFTGLVYFTPLLGGFLADNYIGQRKSILIGGFLMALGQFLLCIPHGYVSGSESMFLYVGLFSIIVGNGFFKPNISTMVGDLYQEGDNRRDAAFTIFYMGINIGAALSGFLVAWAYTHYSTVSNINGVDVVVYNWQAGFALAGIGMVLSLIIQSLFAQKYLGDIGIEPSASLSHKKFQKENRTNYNLTKEEQDRIKVIIILGFFTVVFWAGFEQAGGLMNLFANQYTDRTIGSFEVPTAWFQSLNPIFIVIFAPIMAAIWAGLGPKEPNSPVKFAIGITLMGIGFVMMMGAVWQMGGDPQNKSSIFWLIFAYLLHTLGELCLSPIGLSMITKLSPLRFASFMMGLWFLFIALANKVAGLIGAYIGESEELNNAMSIFGGIAVTAIFSGIVLYFLSDKLIEWMHGAEDKVLSTLTEEISVTSTHEGVKEKV